MSEKPTLNIVLVEPRIPQNTGNVARTCACTACRLHLVGPMGFAIDDKKLKHAGLDYWHYLDINYYDGLEDFFARNKGPFFVPATISPKRHKPFASSHSYCQTTGTSVLYEPEWDVTTRHRLPASMSVN